MIIDGDLFFVTETSISDIDVLAELIKDEIGSHHHLHTYRDNIQCAQHIITSFLPLGYFGSLSSYVQRSVSEIMK